MLEIALKKRVLVQGFIISDHEDEKAEFEDYMSQWIKDKRIKALEDFVDGIENAPQGLIGLLSGHNQGKVIVHCGSE